jgi:hypothetical protein
MAIIRACSLGGIAGPVLFGSIVFVSAELRPEYSHFSQFMSELGETGSRSEGLMNLAGFLPTAVLVFLSSVALLIRFRGTWPGVLGSMCVSLFALGMFAAGLFPCDVSCTPAEPSRTQRLHEAAGMVADPALVLAPLILGLRFRQLEKWRSMFSYSVATFALGFGALVAMVWSLPERHASGVFQRILVGVPFLWLALVSARLWISERSEARPAETARPPRGPGELW